jgi:FkbM family methyltransferase
VVYDIGAHHGNWTKAMRKLLPSAEFVLFEANPGNASQLQTVGARYFMAALSDKDGVRRDFYLPRNAATTGASLYKEQTTHYLGENLQVLELTTQRLDTLAAQHQLPAPDLIKLDVQGAELDVLRGAGSLLETSHIFQFGRIPTVRGTRRECFPGRASDSQLLLLE